MTSSTDAELYLDAIQELKDIISNTRKTKKLSQVEMAKKLNMSRNTYGALEKNIEKMTLRQIRDTGQALGVDPLRRTRLVRPRRRNDRLRLACLFLMSMLDEDGSIIKDKLLLMIFLADSRGCDNDCEPYCDDYLRRGERLISPSFLEIIDELFSEGIILISTPEDGYLHIALDDRASVKPLIQLFSRDDRMRLQGIWRRWNGKTVTQITRFVHALNSWVNSTDNALICLG